MRVFRFRLSRRRPPCRRPTSQPPHATSMCRPVARLLPLPLLLSTACATSLSELHRLVRPRRRRLRPLCLSRRRPPYRRQADDSPPPRATRHLRSTPRPRTQPLLSQTPPSAPSPHRRRLRARAAQLRRSLLRPPSTRRQIDSSLAPRATRHLRSTPRLGPLPLLSQAPPSTPPLQRQHLRPRTVRPRQQLRRSFRCPPRRRPASGQPPHATLVRRMVMRLLRLPRLSSTSCATSLANLPRLVWPRRRRPRLLLRSPLHWSSRRPASGQPSHLTLERHFVTRLLPLALAT